MKIYVLKYMKYGLQVMNTINKMLKKINKP